MPLRILKQAKKLAGKTVLVRVDFNVGIKNGRIVDDERIIASIPTIKYLVAKKARVILITHLGRPEGHVDLEYSIWPVAKHLEKLMNKKIVRLNTKGWKLTNKEEQKICSHIKALHSGEVAIMENIRFSSYEQKNTDKLAKKLAACADMFVLDGFAVAHRADASVSGVAKYLPSFAGLLLEKEIINLSKVTNKIKKPYVAIIGGVKTETKIPVIAGLLPKVDKLLIGGGVVNTYLWARGFGVGDSLIDKARKKNVLKYCKKNKVILPVDVIAGDAKGNKFERVLIGKKPHVICKKGHAIYDIGPETVRLYAAEIKKANTLLWNGAMGMFEVKPYHLGTLAIARLIAYRSRGKAFSVIGGGETIETMNMTGLTDYVDFVSTGGGAMLEFLSGKSLPGLEAVGWK